MIKKALVLLAAGAFSNSLIPPVSAQSQMCGDSDKIEDFLKNEFNETAIFEASHESGATLQFFMSPDMKTGTFIFKRDDGLSCFGSEVTNIRLSKFGPTKEI